MILPLTIAMLGRPLRYLMPHFQTDLGILCQALSIRADLLSPAYLEALTELQDGKRAETGGSLDVTFFFLGGFRTFWNHKSGKPRKNIEQLDIEIIEWRAIYLIYSRGRFCFFLGSWFYAFLLSCCSASLLFCFFASLLFRFSACLLLCFSAFCFSCFFLCFSCFSALPASFLFCFSAFPASLLFCFCASVPFYFYYYTFSFLQSCVVAALLPAPLLLCFLSLLPLCFCSFLLPYSLLFSLKTLGETQRSPKEILIRTPDKKPLHETLNEP